ncbi:MAG: DUF1917 domain-containing protein [Methanomicrobiaceae archaeon]|nr:DUF1917 domain-containing protein [Methanomicrobiaceae archaeon]
MENAEEHALGDVAYGLFEILLNKELQAQGHVLFELVEKEIDFLQDFTEIFSLFQEEYPQLAEALLVRFTRPEGIYAQLRRGEGVIPTRTTQMYWIIQDAPGYRPEEVDNEKGGKWLIFLDEDEVDAMWQRIRDATCRGTLGISAKVSTAKPNPDSRDTRKVIYVYTENWEDEEDVMRVRRQLADLGVEQRIGYKRNIETYLGEYSEKGKKVTFYSA